MLFKLLEKLGLAEKACPSGVSRRSFLQLLGLSTTLAMGLPKKVAPVPSPVEADAFILPKPGECAFIGKSFILDTEHINVPYSPMPPLMTKEEARLLNEAVFKQLSSPDPEFLKKAVDAVNDFTRIKMREEGFYRRIMPPIPISNDELDRFYPWPPSHPLGNLFFKPTYRVTLAKPEPPVDRVALLKTVRQHATLMEKRATNDDDRIVSRWLRNQETQLLKEPLNVSANS